MRTDNIFDYLESENTINNSSIIEDTGVRTDNVLRLVKEKLDEENGKENVIPIHGKAKTARIIAAVIAAAIAVTAVTAQALGSFKDTFGDFLIGESPDGIYSGDNLSIESETSNIEFLGIAGDINTAAAAMRITKPDGSDFVDDIENTWISSSSSSDGQSTFNGNIIGEITYTRSKWSELTERDYVVSWFGFYFEDTSAISAYILSNGDEGGIKGETMTAEISGLSAYTCKEILYDFSENYDKNEYMEDFNENLIALVQEYGFEENDGKRLMINPETKDIVLAEETPLDIEFKLSVTMNYKTSSRTVDAGSISELCSYWTAGTLDIQPFTIILNAEMESSDSQSESGYYPEELKLTLSDESSVTAYLQRTKDTDSKKTVTYRYYNDNGNGSRLRPITIDPDSVVSVEADGVIIYE